MNLKEYAALLDDPELSHEATRVYLVFRRYMDFETGVAGKKRIVDYNELRQSLEYLPARGSRDAAKRYSKDQIKRYIKVLVDRGYLVRLHDSGLRQAMVFKLPLASCDLNRLNEERHESATRGAPRNDPVNTAAGGDLSATRAPREERHISDISENSLSAAGSEKFSMYRGWGVGDEDRLEMILSSQGLSSVGLNEFEKGDVLTEFVEYWSGRPDKQFSQHSWEIRFADSVARALRKRA